MGGAAFCSTERGPAHFSSSLSSYSGRPARALAEVRRTTLDHSPLLIDCQLGEHRQGEHRPAGPLADGEVAVAMAQERQSLLQVQRYWIVDLAADLFALQVTHQAVALAVRHAHDILVERVPSLRMNHRSGEDVAQA